MRFHNGDHRPEDAQPLPRALPPRPRARRSGAISGSTRSATFGSSPVPDIRAGPARPPSRAPTFPATRRPTGPLRQGWPRPPPTCSIGRSAAPLDSAPTSAGYFDLDHPSDDEGALRPLGGVGGADARSSASTERGRREPIRHGASTTRRSRIYNAALEAPPESAVPLILRLWKRACRNGMPPTRPLWLAYPARPEAPRSRTRSGCWAPICSSRRSSKRVQPHDPSTSPPAAGRTRARDGATGARGPSVGPGAPRRAAVLLPLRDATRSGTAGGDGRISGSEPGVRKLNCECGRRVAAKHR